mgnify:FL=1
MFCRRVIRTWSRSATLAKKKTKLPSRIEWTTPRFDWVDPKKDVESETEELSTSRMSFSEAARKRGYNPQKLVEEIKKDKEMFKKAGIEYPFNGLLEEKKVEQEK